MYGGNIAVIGGLVYVVAAGLMASVAIAATFSATIVTASPASSTSAQIVAPVVVLVNIRMSTASSLQLFPLISREISRHTSTLAIMSRPP